MREHNDRIEQAWVTARLNAYAPTRSAEFVKLAAILDKGMPDSTPTQSPEQQFVLAKSWASRRR